MLVNIKVTGGLNIVWGQIDPKGNRRVKERRSKYKQLTNNIFSQMFMFIPRFQFSHGNLVKSPGNQNV